MDQLYFLYVTAVTPTAQAGSSCSYYQQFGGVCPTGQKLKLDEKCEGKCFLDYNGSEDLQSNSRYECSDGECGDGECVRYECRDGECVPAKLLCSGNAVCSDR